MAGVHFRLRNYRGLLLSACAALACEGSFGVDTALGQLRTGRNGSREFYDDSRSAPPKRHVEADDRKNTTIKNTTSKNATSKNATGNVIQAGCTSCVQGSDGNVIHHHHDSEHASDVIVESEEGLVHGSHASCGACGSTDGDCSCDGIPHINIKLAFPFARAFEHLSVRMEAATFWRENQNVPAIVRTGDFGVGSDLFGGTVVPENQSQGYRGEFAWRFSHDSCTSVQVRFFDAGVQSLTFDSRTAGTIPNIVLPYNNAGNPPPGPIVIRSAAPPIAGDVLAHTTSDLFGGDVLLKQIAYRSCNSKLDVLFGYQTASLSESVYVNSSNAVPAPGNTFLELRDRFDTNSRFHAGVIGLSGIAYAPRWSVSGIAKLGMGNMNRYVGIDGDRTIAVGPPPLAVASENQGLHARATNIGNYQVDTFVVSPEVNVTFGFRLTRRLEATVGYDYLLLPKVARAADQFDSGLLVNLNNPPTGNARPRFVLTESDLGVHSLNYGLQYRY